MFLSGMHTLRTRNKICAARSHQGVREITVLIRNQVGEEMIHRCATTPQLARNQFYCSTSVIDREKK